MRRAGIISQCSTGWCSGRKRPGKSCGGGVRAEGGDVCGRGRTLILGQTLCIEQPGAENWSPASRSISAISE